MCLNLCVLSALLLGVLYLFFGAFVVIFENNHNFTLWQIGLTFSGIMVGELIGVATNLFWQKNYIRLVQNVGAGTSEPEFRLPPAIAGAVLVLFW